MQPVAVADLILKFFILPVPVNPKAATAGATLLTLVRIRVSGERLPGVTLPAAARVSHSHSPQYDVHYKHKKSYTQVLQCKTSVIIVNARSQNKVE
jgi:hypothetical protein